MLHNMKGQFAEHLMHAGFVSSRDPKDPKSNVNSGNLSFYLLSETVIKDDAGHANLLMFICLLT